MDSLERAGLARRSEAGAVLKAARKQGLKTWRTEYDIRSGTFRLVPLGRTHADREASHRNLSRSMDRQSRYAAIAKEMDRPRFVPNERQTLRR